MTNIAISNGGSGYTSAPTVVISGGGGAGAFATAVLTGGVVTSVNITNGGYSFTSAPTVTFSGGGATTAATGTATINGSIAVLLSAGDYNTGNSTPLTTFYNVDQGPTGPWTTYTTGTYIPVLGTGAHNVYFYSVDSAGNAEAVRTQPVNIDPIAPTLTVNPPTGGVYGLPITISGSYTAGTSGVSQILVSVYDNTDYFGYTGIALQGSPLSPVQNLPATFSNGTWSFTFTPLAAAYASTTGPVENIHWFAAVSITGGNGTGFGAPNSPFFAITKATPTLAVDPVNITYGAALANSQLGGTVLNGSTAVAGTFTYTTAAGTVLNAGNGQSENVTFTPTDTTDYTTVTGSVIVNVAQASLTITADNQSMPYGGPLPTLTASYSGFVNGDTAASLTTAPTLSTTATTTSPAGGYPITASGAVDPNYNITYVPGTLTVTDTAPQIVGAYVSGSTWNPALPAAMAAAGVGDATLGFELPDGAAQLSNGSAVNEINVDTITIVFNKPVSGVSASSLSLGDSGNNGGTSSGITVIGETSPNATTATFTLSGPLTSNKFFLDLASAGITDAAGTPVDGAWITSTSTFAVGSGDGVPGSNFIFRFNVLVGDVNGDGRVSAADAITMRNQPLAADDTTNWRYDINGDGKVGAGDVIAMRNAPAVNIVNFPDPTLPAASAAVVTAAPAALAVDHVLTSASGAGSTADSLAPALTSAAADVAARDASFATFGTLENVNSNVQTTVRTGV